MKTLAYSCPFVPCELIAACGLRPARIVPDSSSADAAAPGAGTCRYAAAFIGAACGDSSAGAVAVTTVCDQMRRASEIIAMSCGKPVFLMNVPRTWQTAEACGLYADELKRLGRFLENIGGDAPSEARLAEVMLDFDTRRRELIERRESVTARKFAEAVLAFPQHDLSALDAGRRDADPKAVPLALVGGELLRDDLEIFDCVENAGGRIVLNATDCGERGLPRAFDRRRVRREPLAELADAYFGAIPHACRRPNSELYAYLGKAVAERGVRGIIFRRYAWCDTWNAESQRMREWASVPVLDLDMACEEGVGPRTAERVKSFMEMLS